MIQQLIELSMPTNFSVFWAYHASHRAGGWPAVFTGRGEQIIRSTGNANILSTQ